MRTLSEILGHLDVDIRSRVALFFLSPRVPTKVKGRMKIGGVEVAILAGVSRLLRCEDLGCCESPSRYEHRVSTRTALDIAKLLAQNYCLRLVFRTIFKGHRGPPEEG